MTPAQRMSIVLRHMYSEPKFRAQVEWMGLHPGLSVQLQEQVGHDAMEAYVDTGQWPEPEREVVFVLPPEPPDWDWWEPTTEWRRKAARRRELDALLA